MCSRVHPALLLLLALLMLVSTVNSTRQENDDLTNQTKGDSRLLRRSKRRWVITTLELEEEDPGPFPKFVGELFNNMSANMEIIYLIRGPGVDEYPEIGLFSIEDNVNGKIYVHRPVDREKTPSFKVYFDVANRLTGHIVDKSLIVNIRIKDVNDHAPEFPEKEFNISVKEDHAAGIQGQPVFQMSAVDLDQENTPNSQVLYFLVSQTPVLRESGFRIDRVSGEVRLSGCLDYEMAPRFTLLIEARDCGNPPLSSTATVHVHVQDSNNHMPRFTQDHYNVQISEGWASQGVLRLGVQDGDSPSTAAWRVKFNITNGNEEGHFHISTDPETNEGILNIIKPLDHETQAEWNLVVAVENEEPLFSCDAGQLQRPRQASASATVSVWVTNVNDPPTFHPGTFIVSEVDGAGPGTQLGMFNATDPDRTAAGQIRYKLAYDPANWVSIDERSGVVITVKPVDRESPHVNDSIYVIIAHAVDDGVPPQTGTGTMLLFLSDVNDNAPTLRLSSQHLEVCQSAGDKSLLIEAEDSDLEPYSDPFTFKLDSTWGDTEDMWRLGENRGCSVELLMQRSLPLGDYSVPLLIGDKQGLSQKQTVHVRVCSCPDGFTCAEPLIARAGVMKGALAPLCVAFMALAAALLLLLRCRLVSEANRQGPSVPQDEGIQTLLAWNEESRADPLQGRSYLGDHMPALSISAAQAGAKLGAKGHGVFFEPSVRNKYSTPVCLNTVVPRGPLEMRAGVMAKVLSQLCGTRDPEGDPGYPPHVYAEEGECEQADSLSSLTFSEHDLPPDVLDSLGPKAAPLEEIYSQSAFRS
ncbi:cadherin-like protein 26 isoform X2 [Bos indicus]|uniref:Cadherin-like protein 26 isoform X2 n=1 Tax=Bos indicus TaxID=9915 RepID=A0ABM4TBN0_BOSIN